MLSYSPYTLGVHAGVVPQPVFRPGQLFHNMGMAPMADQDSADHSSTDSKLYASSDMLQAMALNDEANQTPWNASSPGGQLEYDGISRVDVAMPAHHQSPQTWAEPASTMEKTVSPRMLRIQRTPTPASSCESIRTSFLAETNDADAYQRQPLPCAGAGSVASPAASPAGPGAETDGAKASKQSPESNQPLASTSIDNGTEKPQGTKAGRQVSARADPPSPTPRKLGRLRPMPRLAPAPRKASPPVGPPRSSRSKRPGSSPATATATAGTTEKAPAASKERVVELGDRVAKDEFLVKHKQLGLTYKEIRRMGGFTEAESTLRGRYRTLTKSREARVRKPEWSEKDVSEPIPLLTT